MNTRYFLIVFFWSLCQSSFSQEVLKFGKVSKDHIADQRFVEYAGGCAVVLQDVGSSTFVFDQTNGFRLHFKKHMIIKVLSEEGYSWADGEVLLYQDNDSKEFIQSLKGYTYNLQDGKLIKSKLSNDAVFTEQRNDYWDAQKFSMPNVKVGSIIEISYTIVSDFLFNLRSWQFQYDIPSMYSSYTTIIPEYFDYKLVTQGYHQIESTPPTSRTKHVEFAPGLGRAKISVRSRPTVVKAAPISKLDYIEIEQEFKARNINAMRTEAFSLPVINYVTKIMFELETTSFPGEPIQEYRTSWGNLNKRFLDSEYFCKSLDQINFLKNEIDEIKARHHTVKDQIAAAYKLVTYQIKWNGFYSKYVDTSLKRAYDERSGSIADINLLMTALLRELGMSSDPVLVSTRENGIVRENYPVSRQFNYVVCAVDTEKGTMLIDAADRSAPLGFLPEKCLNGRGWRVTEEGGTWINLTPDRGWRQGKELMMALNADLTLEGTHKASSENYASFDHRRSIQLEGADDFIEEIKGQMDDWSIVNSTISNSQNMSEPLIEEYEVHRKLDEVNGLIFFSPILNDDFNENPFKSEDRLYPVDFSFPRFNYYSLTLKIDEGFIIDEMPEPLSIGMPGGKAVFTYNLVTSENEIKVTSILNIRKHLFLPEEYAGLREFFGQLVAKQNEQIVLKRKT